MGAGSDMDRRAPRTRVLTLGQAELRHRYGVPLEFLAARTPRDVWDLEHEIRRLRERQRRVTARADTPEKFFTCDSRDKPA